MPKYSFRLSIIAISALIIAFFETDSASASGISIDAGLTPAQNRLIIRSQVRLMKRNNDPMPAQREMKTYMFPIVVAYGLRPDLTVMVRQAFMRREMSMMGQSTSNSGLADLLVMGKFRLARINTADYTFGIAPTLGLEIPTGRNEYSSDTYDLRLGSLFSGRVHSWGMDLNITYIWNGLVKTGGSQLDPGDEFSVEGAVAHQFSVGTDANFSVAPVLESSYQKVYSDSEGGNTTANTGESIFHLSPGLKVTRASLIFESLVQIPLWQDQSGLQTERAVSFLFGIRVMN